MQLRGLGPTSKCLRGNKNNAPGGRVLAKTHAKHTTAQHPTRARACTHQTPPPLQRVLFPISSVAVRLCPGQFTMAARPGFGTLRLFARLMQIRVFRQDRDAIADGLVRPIDRQSGGFKAPHVRRGPESQPVGTLVLLWPTGWGACKCWPAVLMTPGGQRRN